MRARGGRYLDFAHVVSSGKMVFTRSKTRQQALETAQSTSAERETPQTSRQAETGPKSPRKARKTLVVRLTPVTTPTKTPPRAAATGSVVEETIDELALRAFRAIRGRSIAEDSGDGAMDQETEQDVMMFESDTDSEKQKKSRVSEKKRADVLPTSLKPSMEERPYFSYSRKKGIAGGRASVTWGEGERELMKRSVVTSDFEKRETAPPMYVSKYARARARKEERERRAGKGWYEMKAPQLTPELEKDLKLLRMRNALDPSQHYKSSDWKKLPRFFQVGKVVSGPAEFYSSRLPRRQRKQTIMDELLHNHQFRRYQKKKYSELQRKFSSGTHRKRFIKHKKHSKK